MKVSATTNQFGYNLGIIRVIIGMENGLNLENPIL
jgi:hypothetical protein